MTDHTNQDNQEEKIMIYLRNNRKIAKKIKLNPQINC